MVYTSAVISGLLCPRRRCTSNQVKPASNMSDAAAHQRVLRTGDCFTLCVSCDTAKSHWRTIYVKLGSDRVRPPSLAVEPWAICDFASQLRARVGTQPVSLSAGRWQRPVPPPTISSASARRQSIYPSIQTARPIFVGIPPNGSRHRLDHEPGRPRGDRRPKTSGRIWRSAMHRTRSVIVAVAIVQLCRV